jgi:hypothetical protein
MSLCAHLPKITLQQEKVPISPIVRLPQPCSPVPLKSPPEPEVPISLQSVLEVLAPAGETADVRTAIKLIGRSFSSPSVLKISFFPSSHQVHFSILISKFVAGPVLHSHDKSDSMDVETASVVVTSSNHGPLEPIKNLLDIQQVEEVYKAIAAGPPELLNALFNSIESLTNNMPFTASECKTTADLKQFIIVLELPDLDDPKAQIILKNVLLGLERLDFNLRETIIGWICSMDDESRYLKYITCIRQYMTMRLYQGAVDDARSAGRGLSLLHQGSGFYRDVPGSEFYIDALNEDYMSSPNELRHEVKLWKRDLKVMSSDGGNILSALKSFISFPFTLTPATKAAVLDEDAKEQMNQG